MLGGGAADFLPTNKNGARSDGRDLLLEVRHAGFDLVRTKAELEAVPGWKRPRLFGTFANAELAFVDEVEARSEQPSLADMVRRAIELLQFNRTGYVLVVDVGLTRKAAQANHAERTFIETAELDRAVSTARRFAGENASIFVCGDVGIGGLTLSGTPFRRDSGVALLGLNSSGDPWLTWSSGPHGVRSYGAAKLAASSPAANDSSRSANLEEPAAFYAPSALNTVEDAIVFGRGPGSERLHGTIRNTEVFAIMRDLL